MFRCRSSQQDLHSQAVAVATTPSTSNIQKGNAIKMKASAARGLFAPESTLLADSLPDCAIPLKHVRPLLLPSFTLHHSVAKDVGLICLLCELQLGTKNRRKRWVQDKRASVGEMLKSAKDRKRYSEILQASMGHVHVMKTLKWQLQHGGVPVEPALAPGVNVPLRMRLQQATASGKPSKKTSKSSKSGNSAAAGHNPPGMSLWVRCAW